MLAVDVPAAGCSVGGRRLVCLHMLREFPYCSLGPSSPKRGSVSKMAWSPACPLGGL